MPHPRDSEPVNNALRETAGIGRRTFLTTKAGLAASSLLARNQPGVVVPAGLATKAGTGTLAINGGTPVRTTLLHAKAPGPQYYDQEERQEVLDAGGAVIVARME